MEQDPLHLENVVAVEPKVDLEETFRPKNVISRGGVNRSVMELPASGYGNSNWVWNNITPPSMQTVVEKSLRIKYQFTATVVYPTAAALPNYPLLPGIVAATGAPVGGNLTGCLRAFPLQSALSTISVRINGTPCDGSNADWICMYPHLISENEARVQCSEFPTQPDDLALYVNPADPGRSPFSPYSSNPNIPTRASFVATTFTTVVAAGVTTSTYLFEVVEQIILSPFSWGSGLDSMGLANIYNMTINMKFSDPNRVLSIMPSAFPANTTCVVSFNDGGNSIQPPKLLIEYTSPDPILAARMPADLIVPYELFETNITTGGAYTHAVPMVGNKQIVANSLQMASIPEKVYIYCRPSVTSLGGTAAFTTPDTFLRITGLNITWGNRIGLFSTYSERDLLKCSQSNGSRQDYHSWAYRQGSLMIVDVAKDIGLNEGQTSGQPNTYSTMAITVKVDNSPIAYAQGAALTNYDLYVIVVKSGKMVISRNGAQQILVGPSGEEVIRAVADITARVDSTELKKLDRSQGGSILSGAAKLLSHGLSLVKHMKTAHEHPPKSLGGGAISAGRLHRNRRTVE